MLNCNIQQNLTKNYWGDTMIHLVQMNMMVLQGTSFTMVNEQNIKMLDNTKCTLIKNYLKLNCLNPASYSKQWHKKIWTKSSIFTPGGIIKINILQWWPGGILSFLDSLNNLFYKMYLHAKVLQTQRPQKYLFYT